MTTPDQGELDPTGVARLLAEAWRDRRSGWLTLRQGNVERRIRLVDGGPTAIEGGADEDDFARALEDSGVLSGADRLKVERMAQERECPQASAVLALRLLDPKSLYKAMRSAARNQLSETLAWPSGDYAWSAAEEATDQTVKPHDVLGLLQQELPRRWGTERLFEALMPHSDCRGDIAPHSRRVAAKLGQTGEFASRAIARLDGSVALGQILGECAGDPLAAATLWTLLHTGVLRLGDGRRTHEPQSTQLEFEVEVLPAAGTTGPTKAKGRARASKDKVDNSDKADVLRQEILSRLEALSELNHYSALGLAEDAGPADIKKAYFKAAKKYHPDALARLGLAELRDEAARVFARIAEAFETLSDATKKAAYDAGGDEAAEIDTARLAQAETSFRKGEILIKMGNFDAALEYLEPAVELWPEEPAYQAGLAWALFRQPHSDANRALEHFEIAASQAPDNATILHRLGLVLRALGEDKRGNEMVARARAIDPSIED